MDYDIDNLKLGAWDVTFGTFGIGAVDAVTPGLELMLKEKKTGSTGAAVLGDWIVGLGGTIITLHREITAEQYQKLMPWWDGSGVIPFMPEDWHPDMYDYADVLNLHPQEMGTDRTLDLTLLKAAPIKVTHPERDGDKPDVIRVEWKPYPDRDQLASGTPLLLAYGHIGAPPPPPPP